MPISIYSYHKITEKYGFNRETNFVLHGVISLVKKFDMAGTVEDFSHSGWSGGLIAATTAEHQTELVAFAAIFCSFVNQMDVINITVYLKYEIKT